MQSEDHSILMENGLMIFETMEVSPVLISVPHDGLPFQALSGFFEERKIGYRGRDLHVWPVVKDIIVSVSVNAIRGLMPRTLVDYNRAWPKGVNYYPLTQKEVHTALDDVRLVQVYKSYHASIDRILERSIRRFGKENTLLIDLHGFSKQPPYAPEGGYDLILGTGNRICVPHGNIDEILAEHMVSRGYKVFLPKDISLETEEDYYSADFTTRHHSEKHIINAIQIEVASRFRKQGALELGQKLSRDFAEFIRDNCLK